MPVLLGTLSAYVFHAQSGPGVADVSVNLLKNSMAVSYDEGTLDTASIVAAVENAGYGAPNMDSLIAIGPGAATVYGIYAIYKISIGMGHGDMELVHAFMMDLYFESAGIIMSFILSLRR